MSVKVNTGPKTLEPRQLKLKTSEPDFDLMIQELAKKAEQGIPVESEVKELVEEAKKDPEKMKKLKGLVKDALTGVDSDLDLKIQELAEKDEKGIPVESEVKELIEEIKKNPKMMDAQKKTLKKRFLLPILGAWALGEILGV